MATCTAQLFKPIPPLPFPRQYIDIVDLTMATKQIRALLFIYRKYPFICAQICFIMVNILSHQYDLHYLESDSRTKKMKYLNQKLCFNNHFL